jgi:signal transduction histidine kinase
MRHNLLMAVKEALNNAVKHAMPTKVRIALKLEGSTLSIEISDDGSGAAGGDERSKGSGMENMRKRLNTIGGEFRISSQPRRGTTLELRVDLARQNGTNNLRES